MKQTPEEVLQRLSADTLPEFYVYLLCGDMLVGENKHPLEAGYVKGMAKKVC